MNKALISDEYLALNKQLHEEDKMYGARGGYSWGHTILSICQLYGYQSILDYGCGKASLSEFMLSQDVSAKAPTVFNYDPCIERYQEGRREADVVVCVDVLEHIEPDYPDNVIKDIFLLAEKNVFLLIANHESGKKLADGRDTHLTKRGSDWWTDKLYENIPFDIGFMHVHSRKYKGTICPKNDIKIMCFKDEIQEIYSHRY